MAETVQKIQRRFCVLASSFDRDKAATLIQRIEKETAWKHDGTAPGEKDTRMIESMGDIRSASVVVIIASGNALLHCLAGYAHALHKPILLVSKSFGDRWTLPLGIPVGEKGDGILTFLWGIEHCAPETDAKWKANRNLRAEPEDEDEDED